MWLADYLKRQGCRVYPARDGRDGLQKLVRLHPDLVLLNTADGPGVCRLMKSDPAAHTIPLILLAPAATPEERVEGLLAGAVDYVVQPFTLEEIRLRLIVHLRGSAASLAPGTAARLPGSNLDNILFQSASRHLLQRLDHTPNLGRLAATVGTNAKRLNQAFKTCTGLTVFKYLREARMKKACSLLADSRLEVQAIGLELGFTSGANFATAFKERFDISPAHFRRTCRAACAT